MEEGEINKFEKIKKEVIVTQFLKYSYVTTKVQGQFLGCELTTLFSIIFKEYSPLLFLIGLWLLTVLMFIINCNNVYKVNKLLNTRIE